MITHNIKLRKTNREGVALLLVLLFVVLLAAIVTDFMYKIHVEASLVSASNSDHDAYLAAKSGIATAMSVLHADRVANIEEREDYGVYDSLDEPWAQPSEIVSFNDDVVNITINDEYGKINLNALIYESTEGAEEEVHEVLRQIVSDIFMLYLGLEEDPTDVILDWLDADDNPREMGAEGDYYESLDPPFSCKNGPMDSIEELLLLPGITPEIYFAIPTQEEEEEEERQRQRSGNQEDDEGPQRVPLFQLFTVHGHPEGKVNINTTPIPGEIMDSISVKTGLQFGIDETLQRLGEEDNPFVSEDDLAQEPYRLTATPADSPSTGAPGTPPSGPTQGSFFTTESNVFRITSDGQSAEASVRIEAYVFRDPSDNTQNPEPQLFRILDWRVVR